jgi:hypothetical protein
VGVDDQDALDLVICDRFHAVSLIDSPL